MLSASAQKMIHDYLNLPFTGLAGIRAPYFNNARVGRRGELRALVGKGTPHEIVEEAKIASLQYHAGFFDKSGNCCLHNEHTGAEVTAEDIRRFLIEHNLGVECSGFVTHVLRAHFEEVKKIDIVHRLAICPTQKFWRRIICQLRPVENSNVQVYADDRNTDLVASDAMGWNYSAIQPADLMILLNVAPHDNRNHVMLITDVTDKRLAYVHARAWASEGRFEHGVAEGEIRIVDANKGLLEQEWMELNKNGNENETWIEAKNAKVLEIRRINLNPKSE